MDALTDGRSPAVEPERRPAAHRIPRPRVSVVIPCLDESETIVECVRSARAALAAADLGGEVIVADNGSSDGSAALAQTAGARVVTAAVRGYGAACLAGFAAARGDYIVMADGDGSYDFASIPRFVAELDAGADVVVGRRRDIEPGAMPLLHRYVGNPLLSRLLNVLFHTGVYDAHCGMRALRRDALPLLELRATGMEFASEMLVRASKAELSLTELPIRYRVRGGGASKLSSFRDGWRHVRLLLVHAPTQLFVVPGMLMAGVGCVIAFAVVARIETFGRAWDIHTLVAGSLLMIVGVQVVALGICAHAYATYFMGSHERWFERMRARLRLEHGLLLGAAVALAGLALCAAVVAIWADRGFGRLAEERLAILGATFVIIGLQTVFSSFLLSILGLRRTDAALSTASGDSVHPVEPAPVTELAKTTRR